MISEETYRGDGVLVVVDASNYIYLQPNSPKSILILNTASTRTYQPVFVFPKKKVEILLINTCVNDAFFVEPYFEVGCSFIQAGCSGLAIYSNIPGVAGYREWGTIQFNRQKPHIWTQAFQ